MNIEYPCSNIATSLNHERAMAKHSKWQNGKSFIGLIGLLAAFPLTAAKPALPPSSVVLIWAAWCAPCRAEIDDFDRLATAARPLDTIVLATGDENRSKGILTSVPAAKLRFTSEGLPALYRRLGITGPIALPLSAATDAQGRICATIRGGANVAKIESAKRECDAYRPKP